jgi:hypothetical protein
MSGKKITAMAHKLIEKSGGESYVMEQVASGRTLQSIADEIGVSRPLLSMWANAAPRKDALAYAKRQAASALAEQGLSIVDAASDPTDVPAAKLQSDYRRWMASRLSSEDWGEQRSPSVVVVNALHLGALRQARVIEEDQDT